MSDELGQRLETEETAQSVAGIHLVASESKRDHQSPKVWPTILLVEDENFVREAAREVLRNTGYSVVAVKTAAEAVRVFEEVGGGVDLLLTDVVLPGEAGPALAARLRQADPGLNVLYVTGYAEQMKILEARHDRFLAKPFSSEKLLNAVWEVLAMSDLEFDHDDLNHHDLDHDSSLPAVEGRLHHLSGNL
jgi:two-component system cell cycle sensor histidine kinase/response regulator CckA